ncbi:hypothetical protein [Caldimonas tepidiphila]|uniref:hypothetical protein n=1 Tax=Caldimonas tepidiphila TaxID=2315841 RepID=UPI000E5AC60E|nr:hypothetical protein [Caldimonas tepidiphila]
MPAQPFASRVDFEQALRGAFALAAREGCARIWLVDPDFEHWPLSEPGVNDSLRRWGLAHRRLTLVAHHFDMFPRRHARFLAWRRSWSHIVECRAWPKDEEGALPSLWLAPGLRMVRLLDSARFRGVIDADPDAMREWSGRCDVFSQRASPTFSAFVLGL